MGFITREAFFAPRLKSENVELPEGTVCVRELTAAQAENARALGKDKDADAVGLYMLAAALYDENGVRYVSDENMARLKELGISELRRLMDVMNRLNAGAVTDLAKN